MWQSCILWLYQAFWNIFSTNIVFLIVKCYHMPGIMYEHGSSIASECPIKVLQRQCEDRDMKHDHDNILCIKTRPSYIFIYRKAIKCLFWCCFR